MLNSFPSFLWLEKQLQGAKPHPLALCSFSSLPACPPSLLAPELLPLLPAPCPVPPMPLDQSAPVVAPAQPQPSLTRENWW